MPLLELKIIPSEKQDPTNVDFTWELVGFNEDYLEIQLDFDWPDSISDDQEEDMLQVTFYGDDDF